MTSDLDSPSPSLGDRARARAYYVDFGLAMAAYLVVLVAVLTFGGLDGDAPSRFVWALLPVLAGINQWLYVAVGACPASVVLTRVTSLRPATGSDR